MNALTELARASNLTRELSALDAKWDKRRAKLEREAAAEYVLFWQRHSDALPDMQEG